MEVSIETSMNSQIKYLIVSNLKLHLVGFKLVVYIWDVSLSWWIIILYILLAAKYPTWLHHRCVTFLTFAQPRIFTTLFIKGFILIAKDLKYTYNTWGGFICTSPSWLSVTSSSSQCCWTRMASQMIECYQFRCHFAESQEMACYLKREVQQNDIWTY